MATNQQGSSQSAGSRQASLVKESTENILDELKKLEESNESQLECGFRRCRPDCFQNCANTKVFTALTCFLATINGSIASSYLPSVITTIEKRFELGSSMSGFIVSAYEIGAVIAVMFISYWGGKRHIPLILGFGTIMVGVGTCLFSLPHFITRSYTASISNEFNQSAAEQLCQAGAAIEYNTCVKSDQTSHEWNIVIFIIAQLLIGIGSTPILTLGLSYIDYHVGNKKSPQHLAFVYAGSALGPAIGFGCGAGLLEIYVDFPTHPAKELGITSADKTWVGAWWLGFLILGFVTFMSAIPFFCFPKVLRREKQEFLKKRLNNLAASTHLTPEFDVDMSSANNVSNNVKDFFRASLYLVQNPLFMMINIASAFEMIIVTGFLTFVPKYFETQFDVKTSHASLYTGGLAIPGAVLGIIMMGVVMTKMKLEMKGAAHLTIILAVFSLAGFSLAVVLGCENLKLVGVTYPHQRPNFDETELDQRKTRYKFKLNLTDGCNQNCACVDSMFNPVCGWNNLTYFSPCFAGCVTQTTIKQDKFKETLFGNCDCITNPFQSNETTIGRPDMSVTNGSCKRECKMLIPFMILLFAVSFSMAGAKTPVTMLTIRCVKSDLRSFGLGVQVVIIRLLALLPAPVIFGSIIDKTCQKWRLECGVQKNCLLHDSESFRHTFAGISAALQALGLLFLIIAWNFVRRIHSDEPTKTNNQNISAFTVSNSAKENGYHQQSVFSENNALPLQTFQSTHL